MAVMPDFAKPIAEARARGQKPVEMVIVSDGDLGLHRRFPANPVVRVRPEQRPTSLSWRFLAGLDVEIATVDAGLRMLALVDAILAAHPHYLRVWNLENDRMMRVVAWGQKMVMPE
jgi:hypothetical protein